MTWRLTSSLDEFLTAAGDHLRADPVLAHRAAHGAETLRAAVRRRSVTIHRGSGGTSRRGGVVDGAFFQTPPFPVLLASLAGRGPPGALLERRCGAFLQQRRPAVA